VWCWLFVWWQISRNIVIPANAHCCPGYFA
jgi:hypothetical protein